MPAFTDLEQNKARSEGKYHFAQELLNTGTQPHFFSLKKWQETFWLTAELNKQLYKQQEEEVAMSHPCLVWGTVIWLLWFKGLRCAFLSIQPFFRATQAACRVLWLMKHTSTSVFRPDSPTS